MNYVINDDSYKNTMKKSHKRLFKCDENSGSAKTNHYSNLPLPINVIYVTVISLYISLELHSDLSKLYFLCMETHPRA